MNYNIAQLEILNIVVALKVWGQSWANKRIQIFCDNRAVVATLNSCRARDETLATCARNIWLLAAMFNITLITSHVYGTKMPQLIYYQDGVVLPIMSKNCYNLSKTPSGWIHTWT